jgi:hypothetical protein
LSKNACLISSCFSAVSITFSGTVFSSTDVNWRELGSWLEGAVSRIFVARSGLLCRTAGLLKTGVGGIVVWIAMEVVALEVEAFEAVVECGGEAAVACAG